MIETGLILGGFLISLVGFVFFLRHLEITKKAKLTIQEEESCALESEPIATVKDVKAKETQVIAKKEVEVNVITPSSKIEKDLEINEYFPQDSMLRRHYLTHLEMMLELIYTPRPTDSTLKRHYQTMIAARIEDCLNNKNKMELMTFNYEVIKAKLINKPAIIKVITAVKPQQQKISQSFKAILPEEGVQRRHYLTNIRAIVESNYPPCPTESALKRHYKTMINSEIEQYLLTTTA